MFSAASLLGTAFAASTTALDGLSMRQKVHAENIANIDTPGYVAKTVNFERTLEDQLRRKSGNSMALGSIPLPRLADGALLPDSINGAMTGGISASVFGKQGLNSGEFTVVDRPDGMAPDRNTETQAMMQDSMRYRMLSQEITNKLNSLRSVISEMGRS